jgi:hypothetical protein
MDLKFFAHVSADSLCAVKNDPHHHEEGMPSPASPSHTPMRLRGLHHHQPTAENSPQTNSSGKTTFCGERAM